MLVRADYFRRRLSDPGGRLSDGRQPPGRADTAPTRRRDAARSGRVSAAHIRDPRPNPSRSGRRSEPNEAAARGRPTRSDSDGPDPERAAQVEPGTVTYHPRSSAGTASREFGAAGRRSLLRCQGAARASSRAVCTERQQVQQASFASAALVTVRFQ